MHSKILSFAAVVALSFVGSHAVAWNALGHRVVAEIPWQQLSPERRQEIVATLKRHPRFAEDFIAKMPADVAKGDEAKQDRWCFWQSACWPDVARKTPYNRPSWHYVNAPVYLDRSDRRALAKSLPFNQSFKHSGQIENYNVVQAIAYCKGTIAEKNAAAADKALVYSWLMHLIGDLHQPLHSRALVSVNQFPAATRAGTVCRSPAAAISIRYGTIYSDATTAAATC